MSKRERAKVITAMAEDIQYNIGNGLGPVEAIKSGIVIGSAIVHMLADIANELDNINFALIERGRQGR